MQVLTPIRLGGYELRNRLALTAHSASHEIAQSLPPTRYIDYLRRRAAGGVAFIVHPPISVEGSGRLPQQLLDRLAQVTEAVHAEGANIVLQLMHRGGATYGDRTDVRRSPLSSFGPIQSLEGDVAHVMGDAEIEAVIEAFADAARGGGECGFDGVEIHAAHGYLVQQSFLPWVNNRKDKWGEDRTLFARRVVEAARAAIGSSKIVGLRYAADDLRAIEDGGHGLMGQAAVARRIIETQAVDYLAMSVGASAPDYSRSIGTYRRPVGEYMRHFDLFRDQIERAVPIIGIGRVTSLAVAESFVRAGCCDIVGMTRAHIADPDVIKKSLAGLSHRVRACVGANECQTRAFAGREISCFQNPEVLREGEFRRVATKEPKHVLVVGAGPAGLKAAETAARRGHRVSIVDACSEPGGLLRAVRDTAAAGLFGAVDWLLQELRELGVHLELGQEVGAEELTSIDPDSVILATGARPNLGDAFIGAASGHVVSSWDALYGPIADDVVVYDAMGTVEAGLVAERLARDGKSVSFVTRHDSIAPHGGLTHRVDLVEILHQRCARIITNGVVGLLDGDTAHITTTGGTDIATLRAGTVVAVTPMVSDVPLTASVESLGLPYLVIGNARAHRVALHAFREGEEAGFAV